MDGLQYEFSGSSPKKRRQEFVIEASPQKAVKKQDEAITFSVQVIKALEEKVKTHNSQYPKRVTLNQLKKVFCSALGELEYHNEETPNTLWALARVNMYSRMSCGETSKMNEVLEADQKITHNRFIEIAANWIPSKEDFSEAGASMDKYNLHYKYSSIEELYLNYQPLNHIID
tara:strand:- start:839 stop:1357 length:519 start_codon:yes stop_codon:yes gene_type:complete